MQELGFTEMTSQEASETYGGSILAILGVIPGLVSAAIGIVHLFQSFHTTKGEVKTKDYQYKWDNSNPHGQDSATGSHSKAVPKGPVYFSY